MSVVPVLRNIAIVLLLALVLTVLPGGSNAATAVLTALSLGFLAAIGLLLARLWKQTSLTRDVMSDRQRMLFYSSLGAIALMIAGLDELFSSGAGSVAFFLIVGIAVYVLIDTWRQASSY